MSRFGLADEPGFETRKAPPRTVSIGSARVQRFPEKRQEILVIVSAPAPQCARVMVNHFFKEALWQYTS